MAVAMCNDWRLTPAVDEFAVVDATQMETILFLMDLHHPFNGAIHVPPLPKEATIASSSLVPQVENRTVGGTFVAQVIVRRGGLRLPT